MRDIKFRAWDKSCNRMFNVITELWFGNNDYFKELFFNQAYYFKAETKTENGIEMHQATSEDCVLMQYTGLKDKNGVEIYEGDIVTNIHDEKGIVEAGKAQWIFRYVDDSNLANISLGAFKESEIEVIGNMYQNPELLK